MLAARGPEKLGARHTGDAIRLNTLLDRDPDPRSDNSSPPIQVGRASPHHRRANFHLPRGTGRYQRQNHRPPIAECWLAGQSRYRRLVGYLSRPGPLWLALARSRPVLPGLSISGAEQRKPRSKTGQVARSVSVVSLAPPQRPLDRFDSTAPAHEQIWPSRFAQEVYSCKRCGCSHSPISAVLRTIPRIQAGAVFKLL